MNADKIAMLGIAIVFFAVFGALPILGFRNLILKRLGLVAAAVGILAGLALTIIGIRAKHNLNPAPASVELLTNSVAK